MTGIGDQIVELRLLSFNLWRGGIQVDFSRVVEAIQASGADIVGLQEPEGATAKLAELLGWPFADPAHHILSRLPLFAPPDPNSAYVLAEVRPGRFVALANLHLNSDPAGTQAVQDGASPDAVMAIERQARLPQVVPAVEALKAVAAERVPVFLLGDFNAPSHLDWTAATVQARPHLRYPLAWPVSTYVAEAGLRDSYRAMHPDPLMRPGITWTPGYPHPRLKPTELLDRIDFIHFGGPAEAIDSRLIGEPGGPEVEIAVSPWPTDHRAVLSTFRVRPGHRPPMIAVDRKAVEQGAPFAVRFHAPTAAATRVAIVAAGDDPARHAIMTMPAVDETDRRVIAFGTGALVPGGYRAVLLDAAGRVLAQTAIRVLARDEQPKLHAKQEGATIRIGWRGAPGNRFDWIAIHRADDPDLQGFIYYRYTDAQIDGNMTIDLSGDLPPDTPDGQYLARLMLDDAHNVLADAPFAIAAFRPRS